MKIMKIIERFKNRHSAPRDYLFIDDIRLDSYLSQISSTESIRRAPSLTVGISDSGPSVSAGLAQEYREKSNHAKICELIKCLERRKQISHNRPYEKNESGDYINIPDFVIEECEACRILIPSTKNPENMEGIVIWVSEWPLERKTQSLIPPGLLCLIQDSTRDDKRHSAGFSQSGYTWLQSLLYQLSKEDIETQLSIDYPVMNLGEYIFDIMSVQSRLYKDQHIFRTSPMEWLKQKGCILSTKRQIVALYRIRNIGGDEIGIDNKREDFTVSTFAYPIAIWAGRTSAYTATAKSRRA